MIIHLLSDSELTISGHNQLEFNEYGDLNQVVGYAGNYFYQYETTAVIKDQVFIIHTRRYVETFDNRIQISMFLKSNMDLINSVT